MYKWQNNGSKYATGSTQQVRVASVMSNITRSKFPSRTEQAIKMNDIPMGGGGGGGRQW